MPRHQPNRKILVEWKNPDQIDQEALDQAFDMIFQNDPAMWIDEFDKSTGSDNLSPQK
jgi:hypothetical protein